MFPPFNQNLAQPALPNFNGLQNRGGGFGANPPRRIMPGPPGQPWGGQPPIANPIAPYPMPTAPIAGPQPITGQPNRWGWQPPMPNPIGPFPVNPIAPGPMPVGPAPYQPVQGYPMPPTFGSNPPGPIMPPNDPQTLMGGNPMRPIGEPPAGTFNNLAALLRRQ